MNLPARCEYEATNEQDSYSELFARRTATQAVAVYGCGQEVVPPFEVAQKCGCEAYYYYYYYYYYY
jgi:hypothetical protein